MVGHRNIFLIILTVFLIVGCNTFNNKLDDDNSPQLVQYLIYNRHEVNTITVDTVEFNLIVKKNKEQSIFEYKNDNRKEIYEVSFIDPNGFMINSNDTVVLHFLDKYEIILFQSNDTTTIYKFISLNPGVDNASYLYFSPKLGIVLKKSTTWPTFSELSKHYLDKENTFNLLLSLIYNERSFYNDIPPEIPPPVPTNKYKKH